MKLVLNESKPIFIQIAEGIEDDILCGNLKAGDQVPSMNQLAKLLAINPATAGKGINILVDEGMIQKSRGVGMFVADDAVEKIIKKRNATFFNDYIVKVVSESKKLNIPIEQIVDMIRSCEVEDIDE